MYSVLVIFAVIVAILLTLIVLIQESKGGGLTSNMAAGNSIMGVHKTTDLVEKITWGLAIALVVLCVSTAYVTPEAHNADAVVTEMQVNIPTVPTADIPAANLPATPAEAPAN
jgi:preprotein translocase subunit SecG